MNLIDFIFLLIFITSTILGFYKGFLKITISLLCFISSIILTILLFPLSKDIIIEYIADQLYVNIASGVLSYVIALITCIILNSQITKIIKPITGGVLDKFFGMVAGLTRGALISIIVYLTISIISTESYLDTLNQKEMKDKMKKGNTPSWLQNSKLSSTLHSYSLTAIDLIPEKKLTNILKQVNHSLAKQDKPKQDLINNTKKAKPYKENDIIIDVNTNDKLDSELQSIIN